MFTTALFDNHKLIGTVQDGSRKWVTVVATICADGTSLSPGIIYEDQANTSQDTWLDGVKEEDNLAFLASSVNTCRCIPTSFDTQAAAIGRQSVRALSYVLQQRPRRAHETIRGPRGGQQA